MKDIREILDKDDRVIIESFLGSFCKNISEKYNMKCRNLVVLCDPGGFIPCSIFTRGLGVLEALVKYLREDGMKNKEVAAILKRSQNNTSVSYRNACRKHKARLPEDFSVKIPCDIFSREQTCFESICLYLVGKGMRYTEVAKIMDRDPNTIWTIYNRAKNE